MDEELSQLEAELKRLRLRAPSSQLMAQLESRLATRAWPRMSWLLLPLAAAAALAVGFFLRMPELPQPKPMANPPARATAETAPEVFKPVRMDNVLYAARDEGLVTLDDGRIARRLRREYVDSVTWRDPQGDAAVTWTVPRTEVAVVPVSFH
jgi:hypothetical protein